MLELWPDADEIVVVDDASTDGTSQVLEQCDVKVITLHDNSGPGFAREIGVQNTTGKIIAFIDADCVAPKNWLQKIKTHFDSNPSLGAVGGRYVHKKTNEIIALAAKSEEEAALHSPAREARRLCQASDTDARSHSYLDYCPAQYRK